MFIYEKNKRNSETGKLEQTLNITFEGNKPVENPDVIIDKDGVTGIKSDSNAYVLGYSDSAELSGITSLNIDGEVFNVPPTASINYYPLPFKKYVGWTTTNNNPNISLTYKTDNYHYINSLSEYTDGVTVGYGEFIIDIENLTVTLPNGNVIPFNTCFGTDIGKDTILGVVIGSS